MTAFFLQLGLAFLTCLLLVLVLTPLAHKIGLVDIPDQRKVHKGNIPLIGGLCIFFAILLTTGLNHQLTYFLVVAGLLVIVGALDDHGNLNVYFRIAVEVIAANIMIFCAGVYVTYLGNLLGFGNLYMPFWAAYPFTLIAVFGILNAFNMIDGLDGLAGGVALIALLVLAIFSQDTSSFEMAGPAMAGGLIGFLMCNLRLIPKLPKVFLGDAGSKLIGFALVWWLITSAQSTNTTELNIDPVTALYIVGLPLIDMVTITVRRLKKRISPFFPDRTHIHHILQRAGFNKRSSLVIILILALIINLTGVILQALAVPEVIRFFLFFALYWFYAYNIRHAWRLSKRLKRTRLAEKFLKGT